MLNDIKQPGSQTYSSCVSEDGTGFYCSTEANAWVECLSEKCPVDLIGKFVNYDISMMEFIH